MDNLASILQHIKAERPELHEDLKRLFHYGRNSSPERMKDAFRKWLVEIDFSFKPRPFQAMTDDQIADALAALDDTFEDIKRAREAREAASKSTYKFPTLKEPLDAPGDGAQLPQSSVETQSDRDSPLRLIEIPPSSESQIDRDSPVESDRDSPSLLGEKAISENPLPHKGFSSLETPAESHENVGGVLWVPSPTTSINSKNQDFPPQPKASFTSSNSFKSPRSKSHHKRSSSCLDAGEIAHVRLAMLAASARSKPLNGAIMIRLDMSKAYKSIAQNGGEPKNKSEREARARACRAAAKKLSETIANLRRPLNSSLTHIMKLERPAAGGAGLHAHILCHFHDAKAAEITLNAIAGMFENGKTLLKEWRIDREAHEKLVKSHKLPFDVQGATSFITSPDGKLMGISQAWCAASYICKSADPRIPITFNGNSCSLADILPEKDVAHEMRHLQPIRAFQEQSLIEVGIKKHIRFSHDLEWKGIAEAGLSLADADDAGWMHKGERQRRASKKAQSQENTSADQNKYINIADIHSAFPNHDDRMSSNKWGEGICRNELQTT
ncbi:hypothetical protein [Kozakia baliensis]|uniref:hypothetical protein n=1 Tax=Kozakia baliensis TaxID=153496 RepID=UPI00087B575D|nr:hypothetical protein [Kozakia baliensis]AOX20717.1 hypothetical protein A0U90_10980 [Kozakia baliensis]